MKVQGDACCYGYIEYCRCSDVAMVTYSDEGAVTLVAMVTYSNEGAVMLVPYSDEDALVAMATC